MIQGSQPPQSHGAGSTTPPRVNTARLWYLIGLFCLGLSVGYFCGLSESPVVATLLPLLFALIGGANGLFIFGWKAGAKLPSDRLRLAGLALISFCVATVVSSVYAIAVRTGADLTEFVPSLSSKSRTASAVVTERGQAVDDLKLALLDAQLSALGVSPAERRRIVAKGAANISGPIDATGIGDLELLARKAQTVAKLLEPTVGPLDERQIKPKDFAKETPNHPVVIELYLQLKNTQTLCNQWTEAAKDKTLPYVARASVVGLVADLERSARALHGWPAASARRAPVDSISVYQWLDRNFVAFDTRPLMDLEQYIHFLYAKYGSGDWVDSEEKLSESINKFLSATKAQQPPGQDRRRPSIKP